MSSQAVGCHPWIGSHRCENGATRHNNQMPRNGVNYNGAADLIFQNDNFLGKRVLRGWADIALIRESFQALRFVLEPDACVESRARTRSCNTRPHSPHCITELKRPTRSDLQAAQEVSGLDATRRKSWPPVFMADAEIGAVSACISASAI